MATQKKNVDKKTSKQKPIPAKRDLKNARDEKKNERFDLQDELREANKLLTSYDRRTIVDPLVEAKIITKASISQMLSGTFISEANIPTARVVLKKINEMAKTRLAETEKILSRKPGKTIVEAKPKVKKAKTSPKKETPALPEVQVKVDGIPVAATPTVETMPDTGKDPVYTNISEETGEHPISEPLDTPSTT